MSHSTMAELTGFIDSEIIPTVNVLRFLLDKTGCVIEDLNEARRLLNNLRIPVRKAYTMIDTHSKCPDAFDADLDQWLAKGLDTPAYFDYTLEYYTPPSNHTLTFFIGPLVTPNGLTTGGISLECLLAYREEPDELECIGALMPHPKNKCQSSRLLTASTGLLTGNCIVFFPENVLTSKKIHSQTFALFFFNKFQRIYLMETIPQVQRIFGTGDWTSASLSPEDCYRARCIWGYLHDYFHHKGPRPFDTNIQVKMSFFVGLLEELKVDCQSAVIAYKNNIPFGKQIIEFILFERLLRYTNQPNAVKNFDAGTGFFLFEWLLKDKYGLDETKDGLKINLDMCSNDMEELAQKIEAIEVAASDDNAYRSLAKDFVRTMLPEGIDKARFSIPYNFARLIKPDYTQFQALDFADLPY